MTDHYGDCLQGLIDVGYPCDIGQKRRGAPAIRLNVRGNGVYFGSRAAIDEHMESSLGSAIA